MHILPLVFVYLFLSTGFGHASGLGGLTQIRLLMEELSTVAQACGVTKELIQDAFMYPASSSNLKVASNSEFAAPIFYIQIGTLRGAAGLCFSAVNVKVYIQQMVKIPASNLDGIYEVQLWEDSWLGFSHANEHGEMVRQKIETSTKKFLTKWNLDNKPQ
jgi:hypothetical protein